MIDRFIIVKTYMLSGTESIHTHICLFHRTHEAVAARRFKKSAQQASSPAAFCVNPNPMASTTLPSHQRATAQASVGVPWPLGVSSGPETATANAVLQIHNVTRRSSSGRRTHREATANACKYGHLASPLVLPSAAARKARPGPDGNHTSNIWTLLCNNTSACFLATLSAVNTQAH